MTTFGCVMIGRNDNYGGRLKERASYVLNSACMTYDEVIFVDYNSRDKTLIEEIKDNLYTFDRLLCIVVPPSFHKDHTAYFPGAQACSEVLSRNIGLRRLNTDILISTNIDEFQPPRDYLKRYYNASDKDTMVTVARHGTNLEHIETLGGFTETLKIWEHLLNNTYPQSWAHKMTDDDIWSVVAWCGDMQIAHRDLWYEIRGFEEWQLGVSFHDSYVQRKVMEMGKNVAPSYDIPIWHLDHTKTSDYNESCNPNPKYLLLKEYPGMRNTEDWGFPREDFMGFKL